MNINLLSERYMNDGNPALSLSDIQKEYIRLFNNKCKNGDYSFRSLECECGNSDFEVIAQKDRYGIPVDTVICKNCGLIITNPCLDEDSNNSFYNNEYPFIYRDEIKPSDENFLERKNEARHIIGFIKKHSRLSTGTVLEIGCADGGNVAAFADAGFTASGIDLSHVYIEFGKTKGLDLHRSDSSSFSRSGKKFDIIVLNHVLEHFTNIRKELDNINTLLKPDGFLFISVPGVKCLTYGAYNSDFLRMIQNAHIYNFTKTTLQQVMKKHGFDCIYGNELIFSLFKKNNSQTLTESVNAYSDTMEYLRCVESVSGNTQSLLIYRVGKILESYGSGEVLLYGTAPELDALTQQLPDLTPIKGFFYSDKKSLADVENYIRSVNMSTPVKCLLVIDSKQDKHLKENLTTSFKDVELDLYSVYSELM